MKAQKHDHTQTDDFMERLLAKAAEIFRKYWRPAGAAVFAALIVLLGYHNYMSRRRSEHRAVWSALEEMHIHPMMTEDELREIVDSCHSLLAERWKTQATPWVLLNLGSAHLALGEAEAAARAFGRITEEHPRHYAAAIAIGNLGTALELKGDYQGAAEAFTAAAEKNGGNVSWWLSAGRNLELAGNRDAAMKAYKKAVEKAPDPPVSERELELAEFRLEALKRKGAMLQPPPDPPAPLPEEEMEEFEPEPAPAPLPEADPEPVPEEPSAAGPPEQ